MHENWVDVVLLVATIRAVRAPFCHKLAQEFAPWQAGWRRANPLVNGRRVMAGPQS